MDIQLIMEQVRRGTYYWRQHAIQRSIERGIREEEVVEALLDGEIIEEYPEDKYGPSCLVLGRTSARRTLHVQCSLPPTVWIITLYEPDSEEWIDFRTRKGRINP
jgi:Domain of unknown function (DUF4258)